MMENLSFDEMNLIGIYSDGSRTGTIAALTEMRGYLEPDETELLALTDATIGKLEKLTDVAFSEVCFPPL